MALSVTFLEPSLCCRTRASAAGLPVPVAVPPSLFGGGDGWSPRS